MDKWYRLMYMYCRYSINYDVLAGSWTVAHHVIVLILSLIWTPEWLCRVFISWFHSGCFKSKITLISYFCSLLVSFTTALCYFICWFFIAHVKQTPFNITLLVIHVQNVCLVEWAKVHVPNMWKRWEVDVSIFTAIL